MKKTFGLDMDSMLVNMNERLLGWHNRDYGDIYGHLTEDHVTEWDIAKISGLGKRFYQYFAHPHFFKDLIPNEGAIEAAKAIGEMGYDLIIVSSATGSSDAWKYKVEWCHKHLPFIDPKNICLMARKELLKLDILADDAPHNIEAYRAAWGDKTRIVTIDWPYNRKAHMLCDLVAYDYKNMAQAWSQIKDYAKGYAWGTSLQQS